MPAAGQWCGLVIVGSAVPLPPAGDHAATAVFIARQLGIIDANTFARYNTVKDTDPEARKHIVLRGDEIQEIPPDEKESRLARYVLDVCVFARVSPEHKLRIVRALKETHGRITSMTGEAARDRQLAVCDRRM